MSDDDDDDEYEDPTALQRPMAMWRYNRDRYINTEEQTLALKAFSDALDACGPLCELYNYVEESLGFSAEALAAKVRRATDENGYPPLLARFVGTTPYERGEYLKKIEPKIRALFAQVTKTRRRAESCGAIYRNSQKDPLNKLSAIDSEIYRQTHRPTTRKGRAPCRTQT